MDFVTEIFGPIDVRAVSTHDISAFTRDSADYSVIIAITDDVPRTKKIFREVSALVSNKLCYAIMTASTPQDRAKLVRAQFDDVFDMRSDPREILLRIHAQFERQKFYNSQQHGDREFEEFCEENVIGSLYRLQIPLLKRLFDSRGTVVKFRELAAYDYHSGEFRMQSLSVRVHYLRRKLKNYDIRCRRGEGYVLVKVAD